MVVVVKQLGAAVGLRTNASAIYGWLIQNLTDKNAYVQIFDAALKDVKLGVTDPAFVIPVAPNGSDKELPSAQVMPQATTPAVTHLETKIGLTAAATTEPHGDQISNILVNLFLNQ